MTKITSAIAVTLIASASFASAALAAGDYYNGANEPSSGVSVSASTQIDRSTTGSIRSNRAAVSRDNDQQLPAPISRGDYYEGANRPN